MKKRVYEAGEFIIKEGDDANEVFIVETGEVEVSHDEDDGTRQKIKDKIQENYSRCALMHIVIAVTARKDAPKYMFPS